MTAVPDAQAGRLPGSYLLWLSGAVVSQAGDAALYFALGWAASAHGGPAAGLVLTAISLPRTVFLLIGGAVSDRLGVRRVMITGDGIMLVAAAVLTVVTWFWGTPLVLLIITGLVVGTVDAFYLPSSGSMPRLLVGEDTLPRALALRQSGSQLVSMIGGPIGGALVGLAGLTAASLTDSVSFAAVLVTLIAVKPRLPLVEASGHSPNLLRESLDGIRVAVRTRGLGALLFLVGGVAGFVIPVTSLLVPLIVRQHHWDAATAGVIVGAQAAGGIIVALIVARKGSTARPGLAAAAGLAVIAAGELVIGVAPVRVVAVLGSGVMGAGTGVFVSNLAPVLMSAAPRSHLARVQALLTLVQSGALVVSSNLLGGITAVVTVTGAMITCSLVVAVCAVVALAVPAIRHVGRRGCARSG